MHPLYQRADELTQKVICIAVEVHRQQGPDLGEGIYEKCLIRELRHRLAPVAERPVKVEYCGFVVGEQLQFDVLVDECLLLNLKSQLSTTQKVELAACLKSLDVPVGLLMNFHLESMEAGIRRVDLPGAGY
jgi:GxxExxY protein